MRSSQASFAATAQPDPGVLIRMLNLFAARDHVPVRVRCRKVGGLLLVDVDVDELTDAEEELIAAKMRVLVGVVAVRLEQMAWAAAA